MWITTRKRCAGCNLSSSRILAFSAWGFIGGILEGDGFAVKNSVVQRNLRAERGCGPCGRTGPPFSGAPKFIRNPSHFILLTQQLLVRFCLVSKSNFSRSFKQTPISSLQYETKKIYSSRLSTRPFISGRPPNFLFLPSFLVGSTEPSILS